MVDVRGYLFRGGADMRATDALLVFAIVMAVSSFAGFALGQKSMDYACSPAQIERHYIAGAERLYQQLVQQGRIKE